MPEIEYLILADYVRQDAGMTHIMGAGLDTITLPEDRAVPVPVGIVVRLSFSSQDKVGGQHELVVAFRQDDRDLLRVSKRFPVPPPPPGVPEYWRTALAVALRVALPIPGYGHYLLQTTLDDDPTQSRSLNVRVIGPGQA
jgi:hypothetical protein